MAKKLTSAKAKKILHDKSVHGHPLTEQQRKFFGAIAGGAKPYKAEEGGWLDKYEAQGGTILDGRAQQYLSGRTGDLQSFRPRVDIDFARNIAAARKRDEEAALRRQMPKASFIGPADTRVSTQLIKKEQAEQRARKEAQQRSALAQTFGSFTPTGSSAAGAIGAETFVNLNPITGPAMSAGRLTQQALGENPYGFGESTFGNILGGVGILGDIFSAGMVPGMRVSQNAPLSSQLSNELIQQTTPLITRSIVRGPVPNPYKGEYISGRLERNVVGEELPEHLRPRLIDQEGNPMSIEDLDVKPTPPRVPTAEELALSQRLKERNQRVIDAFTNKSSSNFKSEIDWSKWNPDTPKYPELINEYNAIEESTKKAGTWMTQPRDYSIFSTVDEINLNGLKDKLEKGLLSASEEEVAKRMIPRLEAQKVKSTTFQGSPEQFIQQQSSWFKKAFPQGAEKTYRGTHGEMMTEKLYENYPTGRGIFTGDEATAQHYTSTKGKTFDLYHPKSKNSYDIDVEGRSWREVPIEGLPGMTSKKTLLGKPVADTDDIATWMENSGVDHVTMRNIFDGIAAKYSRIVNNKPGNFLKSATGNVGFFDMTNPNIYKSILPYVIPGTLVTGAVSSAQKKENGGWLDKYEQGGMVLKQKTKDNYGTKPNPNEVDVSLPPGFVGLAYNTKGRNYSPAWGGQFAMGGSLPGATGMMYARTINPAPSNGPYAKKTKASAQNGQEMKFYQEGLDFKPKTISQDGSEIPVDPMGYWNPENVGNPVIIPSTDITMEGVDQPLIGISDTGDVQYMEPGEDYEFDGEYVTEYPVMQKGGRVPIYVDNPNDPRLKAYNDSLNLHRLNKNYIDEWNAHVRATQKAKLTPNITHEKYLELITPSAQAYNNAVNKFLNYKRISNVPNKPSEKATTLDYKSRDNYNELKNIETKIHKKPVQPVEYRKPEQNIPKGYIPLTPEIAKKIGFTGSLEDMFFSPTGSKTGGESVVYIKTPKPTPKPKPKPEIELPSLRQRFAPIEPEGDVNLEYTLPTPRQPILPKPKKLYIQEEEKATPLKDFIERMQQRAEERKGERKTRKGIKSQLKCFAGVCRDEDGNIVARDGVSVNNADAQPIEKLDQLLNFTNYNKPTKGGWLDKYN